MSWPTDEMLRAFTAEVPCRCNEGFTDRDLVDPECQAHDALDGLEMALAAAPAVDGWVWCEDLGVLFEHHSDTGVESYTASLKRPCPGPHRQLLLGPEVEA